MHQNQKKSQKLANLSAKSPPIEAHTLKKILPLTRHLRFKDRLSCQNILRRNQVAALNQILSIEVILRKGQNIGGEMNLQDPPSSQNIQRRNLDPVLKHILILEISLKKNQSFTVIMSLRCHLQLRKITIKIVH